MLNISLTSIPNKRSSLNCLTLLGVSIPAAFWKLVGNNVIFWLVWEGVIWSYLLGWRASVFYIALSCPHCVNVIQANHKHAIKSQILLFLLLAHLKCWCHASCHSLVFCGRASPRHFSGPLMNYRYVFVAACQWFINTYHFDERWETEVN